MEFGKGEMQYNIFSTTLSSFFEFTEKWSLIKTFSLLKPRKFKVFKECSFTPVFSQVSLQVSAMRPSPQACHLRDPTQKEKGVGGKRKKQTYF